MLDQTHRQAEDADRRAAQKAAKKAKKAAKKEATAKADAHDYNNAANRNNADTGKSAANAKNADANDESAAIGNNADAANGESAANGNNAATTGKNSGNANNKNAENGNSAADTGAPAPDRGATAVANAIARHPEVDLDTALENHHATAGIPKEDLTHEQIYDAIIAEANFQKRQAIIQRRLHPENPDAPEDGDPPKSRSP